jgi:nucleoid-associated protein YgaU
MKLIGFCALMLTAGVAFAVAAGPPRAPGALPRLDDVLELLAGSSLPIAPLAIGLVDLVWLVWIWITGSLFLELVLTAAEVLANSATWVRALRRVADRVSAPLARHAVAAAFAVQVVSRGVPMVSAQTLDPGETALVSAAPAPTGASIPDAEAGLPVSTYLVREGDTLWSIAEQAYGSGEAYRQIIDANLGRRMPDGRVFSARGVIQPGWKLVVPGADARPYVVQPDDTLSSIADATLGDSLRWTELFEANTGVTTPDGLHTLRDPDVIWPGLRLRIPGPEPQTSAAELTQLDPVDLIVASAPPPVQAASPAENPMTVEPREFDAPPLLRTPHPLDPVPLEPADSPPDAEVDSPSIAPESAVADADVSVPNTPWHAQLPITPLAVGGLGLAAVAGLAFGAGRIRRRLRPLPQAPETEVVVEGGFAEAHLAQDLTRGLHGVGFDPVSALVAQLEHFLKEYQLADVGVLAVRHGRSSTTIILRCSLAEQAILVDLAPVFAQQLGAEVDAWVSADQDVGLRLSRLRRTRLLPSAEHSQDSPCLVPLGVLYDRQVFSPPGTAWDMS